MKTALTVSEAAKKIQTAANKWMGDGKTTKSCSQVTIAAAKKLSNDPIFNTAAYMKYNFPSMFGVTDSDWIENAEELRTLLKGKK